MLFENITQFKKAKSLLKNNESQKTAFIILRKDQDFKSMSDFELKLAIDKIYEGFGENIINAASKMIGGDVSKIDKVLDQMKKQELKFNKEENEICNEFYNILVKEEQIKKDKNNPEYKDMMLDIKKGMNALNSRMQELTISHEKIFSALEEKIRFLTGKSNRKKKYFNTKRATDVVETQTDRYQKIKELTKKDTEKATSLEKFFGISQEEIEKNKEEAEKKADAENSNMTRFGGVTNTLTQYPEKNFFERFELIKNSSQSNSKKRWEIKDILKKLRSLIESPDFKTFEDSRQDAIFDFFIEIEGELEKIQSKIIKINGNS
jgi:hypothetical protein